MDHISARVLDLTYFGRDDISSLLNTLPVPDCIQAIFEVITGVGHPRGSCSQSIMGIVHNIMYTIRRSRIRSRAKNLHKGHDVNDSNSEKMLG